MCSYSDGGLTLKQSKLTAAEIENKIITVSSPSNIALVKYWGKHGNQLPLNPSISFTLSQAKTESRLQVSILKESSSEVACNFVFAGASDTAFALRIKKFLLELVPIFPFIKELEFNFATKNTFPHSAGIASSASSMSAIALSLCLLEKFIFSHLLINDEEDALKKKASFVARLGSGSACRSIFGGVVCWGDVDKNCEERNYFGKKITEVAPVFLDYQDAILIVSSAKKEVSSSQGHRLMENHPFKRARVEMAYHNALEMLTALRTADLASFARIVELEALTLHGLMMSSSPSYCLLHPNSLQIIQKIKEYRSQTGLPLTFTLDAGPNIHLLFPSKIQGEVKNFITRELLSFLEDGQVIYDWIGEGAGEISYAT
ncbi:MAG: hypothetical protein A2504_01240 [Bdellovibrionales bacterium RIFOXYD12_FULL_39_22]|nr:MAG: hypothetical protein A2385_02130 [Bdellovibrionales bacterium RIFOXYB1_FULL_39_21]OFZ42732.1 MAG: hypothetical protein A2485_10315 [Bdellovibrionales bacterium RIFOXYC12_FULL_39_17]OFZ47291.1 MAG: hypothetical protein A2404_14920 [Bdellovibrionales bacterium RIFOXYC1_FULL_39_130]OFZ68497.1 MAG: hypothetical protein A2451_08600 [Bdellovibrionales bacterium RIFOXYC2_FULL_39_8]OFZ75457.1 MAG: hypothetical protein A2560_04190 [Bdellovibrionales bacterium RIFOXYD1_FULL_39_84]OFZ93411.1 MAG: